MSIRNIKNMIGRFKGYGCCLRCRDTWNWKKSKDIWYSKNSAIFPLCEDCFNIIDINEILYYCMILLYEQHIDIDTLNKRMISLNKNIKKLKK